ncbi:sulfide:quinone oxidoreductase, mitochondrial-like isoform X2 [Symsagittifera roscoffensis]
MGEFVPSNVHWEKQNVSGFDPDNNKVMLENGDHLNYEYLIVALGITPDYQRVPGLLEALETAPNVCTNYDAKYVSKTFPAIQNTKKGTALFTHPDTPVKCAGAPQKIMYLAEDQIRKSGLRNDVDVAFAHPGPAIFGVKKYAEQLAKVVAEKDIKTYFHHALKELDYKNNLAVFHNIKEPDSPVKVSIPYEMIHVSPPFKPPSPIASNPKMAAAQSGYLDVNTQTLQHNKYENIFGLGDNINIVSTKTAAAAAAQTGIVQKNLQSVMDKKKPSVFYDGYTSCPLVTGANKGILAEFDGNGEPLQTFPSFFGQHKEKKIWYYLKAHVMPTLYWYGMVKGPWTGPKALRKMFTLGMGR